MDHAALNLCCITTQARCIQQAGVEWNVRSIHCLTLAAVKTTTCRVIPTSIICSHCWLQCSFSVKRAFDRILQLHDGRAKIRPLCARRTY